MDAFPSLEQFLALRDPVDPHGRSAFSNAMPHFGWRKGLHAFQVALKVYEQAKASWETYGDGGPPVGTIVQMLESGHSGTAGVTREFDGVFERDARFFQVKTADGDVSIVCRENWWIHMRVYVANDEFDTLMF